MKTTNTPALPAIWYVMALLMALTTGTSATANPVYSDSTGAVISFSNVEYTEINMADDLDGGQWLVWVDKAYSPSQMRFQHIDAAGNSLLSAGGEILNPSTIFPSVHHHLNPTILADGDGGIFVAFQDSVAGSTFPLTVIQHLDNTGNKLWGPGMGWNPDTAGQTRHSEIQIALADNGGLAVVWKDEYGTNPGLYAQLMDANGYLQWNDHGVWLDQTAYHVKRPRIAWMPTSKLAVAWQEGREMDPYAIYWQVVSLAGSTQLGAGGDPVFIDSNIEYTDHEVTLSTGGNFIVAARARELSGSETGIYVVAQKFGRSSLNAHWTEPNGVICSSRSVGQGKDVRDIRLLTGNNGGAHIFYLWSEYVLGLPSRVDDFLKFQSLDGSGNLLSENYGLSEWNLPHLSGWSSASREDLDLLSVDAMTNGEATWVLKLGDAGKIAVFRSTLNFTGASTWNNVLFSKSYSTFDINPFFAKSTGTADRTALAWMEQYDMERRLRFLFWDKFGLLHHVPPVMTETADVPGDQGGQLQVSWTGSNYDSSELQVVKQYSIWRNDPQGWTHMQTIPAVGLSEYSAIVPTLADSTTGNPNYSQLRVVAHADDVSMTWTTESIYGSSVNNLNPAASTVLNKAYPNPFNPSTTLSFSLNTDGPAKLEIFNVAGRRVAVITNETLAAGTHQYTWQGRNMQGQIVSSGVYFARLKTNDADQVQQLTLIK